MIAELQLVVVVVLVIVVVMVAVVIMYASNSEILVVEFHCHPFCLSMLLVLT